MNLGLSQSDINYIVKVISGFPEIKKAAVFGSRANGNFKPGSDVDIAIYGENVTFNTISSLHSKLEEQGPLPYFFDVVDYTHLNNESLKKHISKVGKIIFQRKNGTDE